MTWQKRIIAYLKDFCSCKEVPGRSRKYITLGRPDGPGYYFVGKAGAVRTGATVSGSVSITAAVQHNVKLWEKGALSNKATTYLTSPLRHQNTKPI